MEKIEALEREGIISVLSEGREVANELKRKLQPTSDSCHILVKNILSSYENAIKLLDCMALLQNNGEPSQMGLGTVFELPNSIQGSPLSDGSDPNYKDQVPNCKKRRKFPKWSEQVKVHSETGLEGQLDDGYNWRKYGQKGILGANHPRAYYRCTHRNTQGCLATKHVQRADNNPSVFEVVYKGKHSCCIIPPKPTIKEPKQEEDPFLFLSETQLMGTNYFVSDSYFSMLDDFGEIISNPSPITNFSFGDLDVSIDQFDFSSTPWIID